MTLRFDEPAWFWALLLLPPLLVTWFALGRLAAGRRSAAVLLRVLAVAAVVMSLARPQLLATQESIAVVGVLDVSGSMVRFAETPPDELRQAFMRAASTKAPQDRVGLVLFDGRARAAMIPTALPRSLDAVDGALHDGTALSEAVALARALIPAGEGGRLVVISDGLETIGRSEAVAELLATDRIAVDTVLVPLAPLDDVAIDSFDLPATALPRSVISTLVTLRATAPTTGTVRFLRDGRPLPLQGSGAGGDGLSVELAPGTTTIRVQLPIGDGPVHQLDVVFEPDDPDADRIVENSRARRVVAVPAGRSVLALGREGAASPGDAWLEAAGFDIRRLPADALPEDPLWLAGFDLVLLDNVSAAELSPSAQQLIVDHVQRIGGGLICTGGPNSFAPGGWKGSQIAQLLPVEIEPPGEKRRPRTAVVFVIDRSGSMRAPVAGARATQQEVANEATVLAIESIGPRAYVGVIAFDSVPSTIVPIAPLDDPASAVARVRRITPDGGTAIGAALRAALDALDTVTDVDRRMVVLLTDGVGSDGRLLVQQTERAAKSGVAVTTIAIGDQTDDASLDRVAQATGGLFRSVRNPRVLPRVLIESVQVLNRPLLREGVIEVTPVGLDEAALLLASAPALRGTVILGPLRSADATLDAQSDLGEPLVARWPAGVGRVAVFASEFSGPWSEPWQQWSGAAAFWERMARWAARSPTSAPVAAEARIEDGRFVVTLEAAAADAISGAVVDGIARSPQGDRVPFSLRRVAPRRFVGTTEATESGPWLAVLSPRGVDGPLPPMLAAAVAPEGIEYERHEADAAPLRALQVATGGREIPLSELASTNLFVRDGLQLGVRERSLSALLLMLAGLLFVADAALRRFALRKQMIAEAITITQAQGREAAALASSRPSRGSARSRSDTTDGGTGDEVSAPAPARDRAAAPAVAPEPRRRSVEDAPLPQVAAAPSADEIKAALAALRGGGAAGAGSTKGERASDASPTTDVPSSGGREGNESLDALRRARDRSRIFPP
ncbi:MAG: VWA domain-containing protein [Phycisphaeraceae bacterium]|nr:VWA domain-containing protein [Phycisphaeraceae bacterium]